MSPLCCVCATWTHERSAVSATSGSPAGHTRVSPNRQKPSLSSSGNQSSSWPVSEGTQPHISFPHDSLFQSYSHTLTSPFPLPPSFLLPLLLPSSLLLLDPFVPSYTHSDIKMADSAGPAVVHCSAGIGRTGVLIAVDIGIQGILQEDPKVDILRIVSTLRQDRAGMVQTRDQYRFIHQVRGEEEGRGRRRGVRGGGTDLGTSTA